MKSLKYISGLSLALVLSIGFSACSNTGLHTNPHNGKQYWVPPNCESYMFRYNDLDTLHCIHNGKETGVILRPASREQIEDDRYQKQQFNNSLNSLNKSLQETNENMRRQNESLMPKTYYIHTY